MTSESKALVPTEVLRPGQEILSKYYQIPQVREWHPSPFMRALGYTRNPDICRHTVKGFTPRDGWWCKECGSSL